MHFSPVHYLGYERVVHSRIVMLEAFAAGAVESFVQWPPDGWWLDECGSPADKTYQVDTVLLHELWRLECCPA